MAAAHARAEDLRRQGGGIAASEPLADAKLHLQADVDRQVAAEKERHAAGTAAQQALAQRRAEEMRQLAGAQFSMGPQATTLVRSPPCWNTELWASQART